MALDILVYGWYGRGNIGDELMAHALAALFAPHDAQLRLVDTLSEEDVWACDAVIIGGGSILYGKPSIAPAALESLVAGKRPVFYIGVGTETAIHEDHRRLMLAARSVITRSQVPPEWLREKAFSIPDLVYSLPVAMPSEQPPKGLLIVPNIEVIPHWDSPHWAHLAWERYKDETAQFLDQLVGEGIRPSFMLMCKNPSMDDAWAMNEVIARMKHRSTQFQVFTPPSDTVVLTNLMQEFEVVLTQRFHGIILAQMAGVPCVSINHHDKLKLAWPRGGGVAVDYHGINKAQLRLAWDTARVLKRERIGSAKELYDRLAGVVVDVIENGRKTSGEPVRGGT